MIYVGEDRVREVWMFPPGGSEIGYPRRVVEVWTADGRVHPPVMEPEIHEYVGTFGGSNLSLTLQVPWWAAYADVVVLGGGGGGHGGDGSINRHGRGGSAGQWATGTISLSGASTTVSVYVGRGGPGREKETPGFPGGPTYVVYGGTRIEGASGAGGSGYGSPNEGASRSSLTAFGRTFAGGTGGNRDQQATGLGSGGGGGSGGIFGNANGGAGGSPGYAWIRFRSD